MGFFTINRDMLPMKGHFFLFNAGTAPLVPYLPTYAKQLGFPSYVVGTIYTILPLLGLIAKPVFGAIGDRYERHKFIFILFQILTIFAFSGLYFIKEEPQRYEVDLSCGNGETFFSVCSKNDSSMDECALAKITGLNKTIQCDMSCNIDKPSMWDVICEDWKIPNYCFEASLDYSKIVRYDIDMQKKSYEVKDHCLAFNVMSNLECNKYLNLPIHANCSHTCDNNVTSNISNNQHLICEGNSSKLQICLNPDTNIDTFLANSKNHNCKIQCLEYIPRTWTSHCKNKGDDIMCITSLGPIHHRFNFTGVIPLDKTLLEEQCSYFKLLQVILPDESHHYPICSKESRTYEHFHSKCMIECENLELNELLTFSASSQSTNYSQRSQQNQLWIFFILMALNWIGMAVVVSIADAICFEKLGENANKYGQQRMWGSAGWGILSLMTGYLIDSFSHNSDKKNYLIAFILMFIFLLLDVIVSLKLKYTQKKMSVNLFKKIGYLFKNIQICHFFLWIVLVGMCTGLLWQFLFWYLEDLAAQSECHHSDWIKTLQGFVSGIQCFLGEIPFLFFSGRILKKIGHINAMSLVLLGFGIRFILYSILTNPWWVLPIELLQGITFGLLYANMASYASIIAPEGAEATLQGLVGAVFEGVGTSLGSFIGGILYAKLGGMLTFKIFGCVALVACLFNVILTRYFFKLDNKCRQSEQEYSSVIHYAAPNDAIDLLNEQ